MAKRSSVVAVIIGTFVGAGFGFYYMEEQIKQHRRDIAAEAARRNAALRADAAPAAPTAAEHEIAPPVSSGLPDPVLPRRD